MLGTPSLPGGASVQASGASRSGGSAEHVAAKAADRLHMYLPMATARELVQQQSG